MGKGRITMRQKINLEPLRGFRDILAPESEQLSRLSDIFRRIVARYGYREVKPPTLERFEIFALKSGEEIRKSMYVFRDKGGREVALRPEATASIARIYLKHLRHMAKPLRLYYIVNCFRYEEPQFARYREFWQAGIELLGEKSLLADIEVLKILIEFYKKIKFIENIVIKIGSTDFYRSMFSRYGIGEEIQDKILHFMDKNEYSKALEYISNNNLKSMLRTIWNDYRYDIDGAIAYVSGIDAELVASLEKLRKILRILTEHEKTVKLVADLAFARGLAYYTGIIFEVIVPGFPVSIAGGGRYDTLIELYGGENVPGTGFAVGIDRTLLAMKAKNVALQTDHEALPKMAVILLEDDEKTYIHALNIVSKLQAAAEDIIVTLFTVSGKLSKLLAKLLEQGYSYAVFIGRKEVAENAATIKNLINRKQKTVKIDNIDKAIDVV